MSRRLVRAVQAGVLGVALVAGAGACTSTGDGVVGTESTRDVCNDLGDQLPLLIGSLTASVLALGLDPSPMPDEQAKEVDATKAAFGKISDALRVEATAAADPALAMALIATADGVDAQAAKVRTVSDIESINGDTVDTSKLDAFCPDLGGQLGS